MRSAAHALLCALLLSSTTARADWITLGSPNVEKGKLDGLTWTMAGLAATAMVIPYIAAATELADDKRVIETKGAVALAVPGVLLGGATMAGLGFLEATDEATALVLLGGPLTSMAGIGLARLASPEPRATFLGGSLGFSAFAAQHTVLAQVGFADRPAMAVLQALFAGTGGVGCLVQAGSAAGAERAVALGCSAASAVVFVHGVLRAAYGVVSRPPAPSPAPSVRLVPTGTGLAVVGAF